METRKFSAVYPSQLSIEAVDALLKLTVKQGSAYLGLSSPLSEIARLLLSRLEADTNAFCAQINNASKSPYTQAVDDGDFDRDSRAREIQNNLKMHLKGRDVLKRDAATRLHIFMQPYWNLDRASLTIETEQIKEMLAKLHADASLTADVALLGLSVMFAELGVSNTYFETIYLQRNSKEGAKTGPSASSLKSNAIRSYTEFCTNIEQAVNYTPNEQLITLFNDMNELRKKHALLIPSKAKKPDEKSVTSAN